jgi:hypothetical protein
MLIRKSTINDLPSILKLIQDGRQKMISEGNITQWTNGHPSNEQIISDIRKGVSHIIIDESTHQPIATFALIEGPDPTYAQIYDGQWLDSLPYYVIHRVASAPGVHGIMRMVLEYAFSFTNTIRIDTHEDNRTMRALLQKYGFTYCGIILLENGDPRLAYQRTEAAPVIQ